MFPHVYPPPVTYPTPVATLQASPTISQPYVYPNAFLPSSQPAYYQPFAQTQDIFSPSPAALPTPTAAYLSFNDLTQIPTADVLVVLAHPDDEIFLSGTMAKLAQAGKSIQTVYVTNGKAGEDVSGQQLTGDALGMARSAEVARALADLGINRPPMVLDFMDGQTGSQAAGIQAQLRQILRQIQPKEVLVHDVTGHPDHKNVNMNLIRVLNEIAVGQSPTDHSDRQILAPLFTSGNVYAAVLSQDAQPTFKSSFNAEAAGKWNVVQYKAPTDIMKVYTGDVVRQRTQSLRQHSTQYGKPDLHGLTNFYHTFPYEEFQRVNFMAPHGQHGSQRFDNNPFLLDNNWK